MECLYCTTLVKENIRFCDDCFHEFNQKNRINYTSNKVEEKITITELEEHIVKQKKTIIKMTEDIKETKEVLDRVVIRNFNQKILINNLKSKAKIEEKPFEDEISQLTKKLDTAKGLLAEFVERMENKKDLI